MSYARRKHAAKKTNCACFRVELNSRLRYRRPGKQNWYFNKFIHWAEPFPSTCSTWGQTVFRM